MSAHPKMPLKSKSHAIEQTAQRQNLLRLIAMFVLSLAIVFSFFVYEANSKLIIKERTKNYSVSGKTGRQIYSKFGRRGPVKLRNKHAIAATQRVLNFDGIRFAQQGNRCKLVKRDVRVTLTYFYPKWTNKRQGSRKAQSTWNRFMKELVRHERVHGKLFKESAKQIDSKLAQISRRSYRSCSSMRSAALREIKAIVRRGASKHAAFDRREKRPTTRIRKLEREFILSK